MLHSVMSCILSVFTRNTAKKLIFKRETSLGEIHALTSSPREMMLVRESLRGSILIYVIIFYSILEGHHHFCFIYIEQRCVVIPFDSKKALRKISPR